MNCVTATCCPRYDKIKVKMFEDLGPSIFPHGASAWWIPILLAIGCGPLFLSDLFDFGTAEGFAMPWVMGVTLPCTVAAMLSVPVQTFRLVMYFLNQPRSAEDVERSQTTLSRRNPNPLSLR
jgi:hypothetical protein